MVIRHRGRFIKGNVPWNKKVDSVKSRFTFTCRFCGKRKPLEEMKVAERFSPPLPACKGC